MIRTVSSNVVLHPVRTARRTTRAFVRLKDKESYRYISERLY